jgi:hypothetical protein
MFDDPIIEDFQINLGSLISESVIKRDMLADKKGDSCDIPSSPSISANELKESKHESHPVVANETPDSSQIYPGDLIDSAGPLESEGYRCLEFPNPAVLIAFYNPDFQNGLMSFYKWQVEHLEELAAQRPTSRNPYKSILQTCNGSGKDFIVIAGFAIWFALCKIKSRTIITSSSGVQLTAQTETYIKDLALLVNAKHGCEIFRIRQRYIKCLLSGSEIRLFATDEKGKAEGYHPWGAGEMAIIVNEGKTVTDEIHEALKRCTGFNYWLEVSSTGETSGFFYRAATTWKHVRRVTAYDCPHISPEEIEADKRELGEHSPLFRSIYLALFSSLSGNTIIPETLITELLHLAEENGIADYPSLRLGIGIDLAAGGDENVICFSKGSKCLKEISFRELDTEICADRIDHELSHYRMEDGNLLSKDYKYIFADDGGVGRGTIDKLERRGWHINRVMNQWPAISNKVYGNRGAENWYRIARIFEEHLFDPSTLSTKTREQLWTRQYKQKLGGGRLFLESKQEAKAHGRPSPDRADGLILSMTGLTIDSFLNSEKVVNLDKRPKVRLQSMNAVLEHYEDNITFGRWKKPEVIGKGRRIFNSLRRAVEQSTDGYN